MVESGVNLHGDTQAIYLMVMPGIALKGVPTFNTCKFQIHVPR